MFNDKFWGDHVNGRLTRITSLIFKDNEDIVVKFMPFANEVDKKVNIPVLMLSDKPSQKVLDELAHMEGGYDIKLFKNDSDDDNYLYLMTITPLRYYYYVDYGTPSNGNRIFVMDKFKDEFKYALMIIPFSHASNSIRNSFEMAEAMAKCIVDKLNNNIPVDEW